MRNQHGPILIAGAGCAGLSLATHLLDVLGFDREIILVEPRARHEYTNDRTWSGFGTKRHRFSGLISKKWNSWKCLTGDGAARSGSERYSYESIRAIDFFDQCLQELESDPRVRMFHEHRVFDRGGGEFAVTDNMFNESELLRPSHTFDSRPPRQSYFNGGLHDILLWQQFAGIEVIADSDCFDADTVTLMDFRITQGGSIRFMYVLPFSRRHALVEATTFTQVPEPSGELLNDVRSYLRSVYGLNQWHVKRMESGQIPMSTAQIITNPEPHVTRIGILGGLARPSTGYAFAAIQEHSRQIAKRIGRGEVPELSKAKPVSRVLDRIFLSYLARFPKEAPSLFLRMASRTNPDRFARFMMNSGNAADILSMIMSMPKTPFIAEAWRSKDIWLLRKKTAATLEQISVRSAMRL